MSTQHLLLNNWLNITVFLIINKNLYMNKKVNLGIHLNSNLNVVKSNKNINSIGVVYNDYSKLQPAVNKTWRDNVYSFNKSLTKHVPLQNLNAGDLLKYYFNMYNKNVEKRIFKGRKRHINRFRRISVNRILISRLESNFSPNKVLINLFAFNPEKHFLIKHFMSVKPNLRKNLGFWKRRQKKLLMLKQRVEFNKKFLLLKNLLSREQDQNLLFVRPYIFTLLRRYIYDIYYKYLLHLNKSKFNDVFLLKLIPFLEKIYNKKVDINVINLKYFNMNSELTSRLVTMKLRKREISLVFLLKKLKTYLNKQILLFLDKTKKTNKIRHLVLVNTKKNIVILKPNNNVSLKKNYFSHLLMDIYSTKRKGFLKNVNYKYVGGIMMKIKGRLTKRFTAARSVKNTFNKGTIKNIYSQRKIMSSTLTKGYLMPNVQYTNMSYKTRVGAFGIKGWLGSV